VSLNQAGKKIEPMNMPKPITRMTFWMVLTMPPFFLAFFSV